MSTESGLSFVICAHRETPEDVEMTANSILEDGRDLKNLEIIVADDNGNGGDSYGFLRDRCQVLVNRKSLGRGVTANKTFSRTQYHPVFPDAHMRFRDGAVGQIFEAVDSGAIACAGVQDIHKESGCQGWGASFRFHRGTGRGRFGTSYNRKPGRILQPFGGCYAFNRDVFERIGGWTDVAAKWGYCEQPIGYMAWVLGIPVVAVPAVIKHRYRSVNPSGAGDREIWLNVAYSHYVTAQPQTWEQYWKPIILRHINDGMIANVLQIPGIEKRREAFQAMRPEGQTDERFFNEVLGVRVDANDDGSVRKVITASVILPTYNDGDEVPRTIRSVLESSKREPEIILVDDVTTDGSCNRKNDKGNDRFEPWRVRILRNPQRLGVCRSRIVGIRAAQEDVLGFMDAHSRAEKGDIDKLIDAAHDNDGLIVATITGLGEEKRLYGSRFCVKPGWGLRGAYNLTKPAENLNRINMAMGSCYFARRDILDKIRLWPALPGKWSYSEQGLAMKCWALDVPIYNLRDVRIQHKMAKVTKGGVTQVDVLLNAHFVHRAYFDEDTYRDIWRPILMERGHDPAIDEMLESPLLKDEADWYQANRKHTDEEFIRNVLKTTPEALSSTNTETRKEWPR